MAKKPWYMEFVKQVIPPSSIRVVGPNGVPKVEQQTVAQPSSVVAPSCYGVVACCKNCGWGQPDGQALSLRVGLRLKDYLCPNCKCRELTLVTRSKVAGSPKTSGPPRVSGTPPDAALDAIYAEAKAALVALGCNKSDADRTLVSIRRANPGLRDKEQIVKMALKP